MSYTEYIELGVAIISLLVAGSGLVLFLRSCWDEVRAAAGSGAVKAVDEEPQLPRVPSQLINLALDDLEKVEKDPRYLIRMGVWHHYARGKCHVCLAGSVLASTCKIPFTQDVIPRSQYILTMTPQLRAIDFLRTGHLHWAFGVLNIPRPLHLKSRLHIVDYHMDPAKFKRQLRHLAKKLAERGY